MNDSVPPSSSQPGSPPATTEELRDDIEKTRDELAESVDALASKLDVKARAGQKLRDAKAHADDSARRTGEAARRAKQKAPAPVQKAVDVTGRKVGLLAHRVAGKLAPVVRKGITNAKAHRKQVTMGAMGLVLLPVAVRRRKGRRTS